MITIEEAARQLGLTPRQVYRRISAARRQLSPYLRRGRNGALLLDETALEVLRLAEDLRQASGVVISEAMVQAVERLKQNGNGRGGNGWKTAGELTENQGKATGKLPENTPIGEVPNSQSIPSPSFPARSGKVEVPVGVLWLLVSLCAVSIFLQLAILLTLYLT